ncbi:MAG: hypothetical protein V9G14_16150 [Cypionkella sp.]
MIWTTTPWTIPQNRAVSFNPTIAYGAYRIDEVARERHSNRWRGDLAG